MKKNTIKKNDKIKFNAENRVDKPPIWKIGIVTHVFKGVDLKVKCPDGDYFAMKWGCEKVDK